MPAIDPGAIPADDPGAMSFTARILVGLGLGAAVGWLLGARAEPFRLAADAFVRLLEMTVLPYLTVSLIAGIGSLDSARAKSRRDRRLPARLMMTVGSVLSTATAPSSASAAFCRS